MSGLSLIGIGTLWLQSLFYLFMRIIASFLRYTGYLKLIKDPNKVRKKAKIGNWYNQIPHLTQDTIRESDKNTRNHQIQESQEVSPFSEGDHTAAGNRQDSRTDIKHK